MRDPSAHTLTSHALIPLDRNYHNVLTLLLRLRQICSHPCLIQEEASAFVAVEDVDHSRPEIASVLTKAAKLVSPEFVEEMKKKLKDVMLQRIAAEKKVRIIRHKASRMTADF